MARGRPTGGRRRSKSRRSGTTTSGKTKVRGHTRSPRGPNRGKKPVRVRGYSRKKPR